MTPTVHCTLFGCEMQICTLTLMPTSIPGSMTREEKEREPGIEVSLMPEMTRCDVKRLVN